MTSPGDGVGGAELYISDETVKEFQPMNINFGIITPLGYKVRGKRNKNQEISNRSLNIIEELKPEIQSGLPQRERGSIHEDHCRRDGRR